MTDIVIPYQPTNGIDCDEKYISYKKELLQVKINGANEDMIVAACEQFGDKTDDEVQKTHVQLYNILIFLIICR